MDEAGTEPFWLAAAEDVILAKLWWRQQSGCQKQWNDVLGIFKVQIEMLDYGDLDRWVQQWVIPIDFDRV